MNNIKTCNFSNCIFHHFLDTIACAVYTLLARPGAFRSSFFNNFSRTLAAPLPHSLFRFPTRAKMAVLPPLFSSFFCFALASPLPHAHFQSPFNVLVAALHYRNVFYSLRTIDRPHRPLYNNTSTCSQHSGPVVCPETSVTNHQRMPRNKDLICTAALA